jgi:mannose-6-phosphate isomerase-like protein (cupin superfamily)
MEPVILKQDLSKEFWTEERCYIIESANASNDSLSIARVRVEPGITTQLHVLDDTDERYIIAEGRGRIEVGDLAAQEVGPGDVVLIPAGVPQRITNIGESDLIFYCVCTPPFQPSAYRQLE